MDNHKLDILCEIVRLLKSLEAPLQTVAMASPAKARKTNMALERFNKKVIVPLVEELNVEFLDFTGSRYEEGLPIEPMNIEDFDGVDNLIVASMLEPTIKEKGTSNILRNGKVILAEAKE